jgi:tetratricopeptide (TPR) repeat protein
LNIKDYITHILVRINAFWLITVILLLISSSLIVSFTHAGNTSSIRKVETYIAHESNYDLYANPDEEAKQHKTEFVSPNLLDLGDHKFPVSTRNSMAQKFINQGINLLYAFNHSEAFRAFQEAARLDSKLAMAYWGQALVLGPNINAMMNPNVEHRALLMIEQAKSYIADVSQREQALINALGKRYSGKSDHRKQNDKAYANAMQEVHKRFPDDPDITMLYVEAMMNLHPWNYWMPDGHPYEGTEEIVVLTENVMRKYPMHPGAIHMYIHLIEPTNTPERANKAADTLLTLMPDAGHIIHMASHIYYRVGRYSDAIKSNRLAIVADEKYANESHVQGAYLRGYYPHNIHFLSYAATADGQSKIAIKAAKEVAAKIDDKILKEMPEMAGFRVVPYWALARFGRWEEILREPEPPSSSIFLRGAWHYVRGLAFVAAEKLQEAKRELGALREVLKDPSINVPLLSLNTGRSILRIAPEVLAGEIAAAQGKFNVAIMHLRRAVHFEDILAYTEPSEWHFPPRLALGAILLESGHALEAEAVYWEDLRRNRNNGWALYGLLQALRVQEKITQSEVVEARFKKTWMRADIKLSSSRFGRSAVVSPDRNIQ